MVDLTKLTDAVTALEAEATAAESAIVAAPPVAGGPTQADVDKLTDRVNALQAALAKAIAAAQPPAPPVPAPAPPAAAADVLPGEVTTPAGWSPNP